MTYTAPSSQALQSKMRCCAADQILEISKSCQWRCLCSEEVENKKVPRWRIKPAQSATRPRISPSCALLNPSSRSASLDCARPPNTRWPPVVLEGCGGREPSQSSRRTRSVWRCRRPLDQQRDRLPVGSDLRSNGRPQAQATGPKYHHSTICVKDIPIRTCLAWGRSMTAPRECEWNVKWR